MIRWRPPAPHWIKGCMQHSKHKTASLNEVILNPYPDASSSWDEVFRRTNHENMKRLPNSNSVSRCAWICIENSQQSKRLAHSTHKLQPKSKRQEKTRLAKIPDSYDGVFDHLDQTVDSVTMAEGLYRAMSRISHDIVRYEYRVEYLLKLCDMTSRKSLDIVQRLAPSSLCPS